MLRKCLAALTIGCVSVLSVSSANADLVITEILYNEVGSNSDGEWVEIYNNGTTAIDLTNYKIGDEETAESVSLTEGMFYFPTGAIINPGEVQLVAIDGGVFFDVYGFLPTYEIFDSGNGLGQLTVYGDWDPDTDPSNRINMSNGNDQIAILGADDSIIDAANWGNNFYLDPGLDASAESDGQSYYRVNPLVDTDTASDWALTNIDILSTPGFVAVPEPSSAMVLGLVGLAVAARRRRRS